MDFLYRRGTLKDLPSTFEVFRRSIMDLGDRLGVMPISGGNDPRVIQELRVRRRPLFEHIAQNSDHFWVACGESGEVVGFARSILRDGVRQLTEFFVLPEYQSRGVGKELLKRAFPAADARHRFILATIDSRALPRYLKSGVYPRFPCYAFYRPAEAVEVQSGLSIEPITEASYATLEQLNQIDLDVLGFRREPEHRWLIRNRRGFLYRLRKAVAGYGYLGPSNGPFALRDAEHFPAILAHAEKMSAMAGTEFSVEVPLVNRSAVDYLLGRGCRLDSFFEFFMSDSDFGRFENYVLTSPPFFV